MKSIFFSFSTEYFLSWWNSTYCLILLPHLISTPIDLGRANEIRAVVVFGGGVGRDWWLWKVNLVPTDGFQPISHFHLNWTEATPAPITSTQQMISRQFTMHFEACVTILGEIFQEKILVESVSGPSTSLTRIWGNIGFSNNGDLPFHKSIHLSKREKKPSGIISLNRKTKKSLSCSDLNEN